MYLAEYKGVFFIEGLPAEARQIAPINTELNGAFTQSQLRTLDDLKDRMREQVLRAGGNCVTDFKYGQRSTFWKSLCGLDAVFWYGTGNISQIDPAALSKYKKI